MKHYFLSFLLAILTFSMISCEDDSQENPNLTGSWNYQHPHFVFEYATDSVTIETIPGKKMSLAVTDIKDMFMGMAAEKMGAYFQGITFTSNRELEIGMRIDQAPAQLKAGYVQSADLLQVTLDTNDLKQLFHTSMNIPALSFKYTLEASALRIYFSQTYLETIVYMMKDQLVELIAPLLAVNVPEAMRPAVLPKIKESLHQQIPQILDQIRRLEIGFYLIPA